MGQVEAPAIEAGRNAVLAGLDNTSGAAYALRQDTAGVQKAVKRISEKQLLGVLLSKLSRAPRWGLAVMSTLEGRIAKCGPTPGGGDHRHHCLPGKVTLLKCYRCSPFSLPHPPIAH
ncbi:hypothetical protein PRIC2_000536 [Phytophthora ramorum]